MVKKTDLCPLCDQFMDLYVTSCRNSPFVDDKCYERMCFGCFHVPVDEVAIYRADGSVEATVPVWDHKNLNTAQQLYESQSCETLAEAKKCVNAVKAAIKAAGLDGRKKPKPKKRPRQETVLNDTPDPRAKKPRKRT